MGTSLDGGRDALVWRVFSALLLAGVVFSTGLHLTVGREPGLSTNWYTAAPADKNPQESLLQQWYPNRGQHDLYQSGLGAWRLSSMSSDTGFYLRQTSHPSDGIAPFRYRVAVPAVASAISAATGWSSEAGFVALNFLVVLGAAVVLQGHLERTQHNRAWGLVGALLLVTVIPVTATIWSPSMDPATVLVGTGLLVAASDRRWLLAGVIGAVGVLVKEIAVVATPMIAVGAAVGWRHTDRVGLVRAAAGAALPLTTYVAVRLAMGGGAFEANFGYDVRAGLPDHWMRLFTQPMWMLTAFLLAFGPLWLGMMGAWADRTMRWVTITAVASNIAAAVVLSYGKARVLGLVAPFLVAGIVSMMSSEVLDSVRPEGSTDATSR